MEIIRKIGERVRLPVERQLWEVIKVYPDVKEQLEQEDLKFLLLGTDDRFTLGQMLLAETNAQIGLVEPNHDIIEAAHRQPPTSLLPRVRYTEGEFPSRKPPHDKYNLIIAKHLIHFGNAAGIAQGALQYLSHNGLFLASIPGPFIITTRRALKSSTIDIVDELKLSVWFGGTVFVLRPKHSPDPNPFYPSS